MRLFLIHLAIIVLANIGIVLHANSHETKEVPCMVDIIYSDDDFGIVSYFLLKLQHKNQTGRKINGLSVLIRDNEGNVIRNSDIDCAVRSNGIDVGNTGQCEKILQTITGKMMNRIGYDIWIKLIEEQKRDLQRSSSCEVIGFKFS